MFSFSSKLPALHTQPIATRLINGLATALLLAPVSQLANANDGVAAYASYTNHSYAVAEAGRIQDALGVIVEMSSVVVNGANYERLQSASLSEQQARELVSRAQAAGYSAWYVSNTSASFTGESQGVVSESYGSEGAYSLSDEDISSLPMAETFPLDSTTPYDTPEATSYSNDQSSYSPDTSDLPLAETLPLSYSRSAEETRSQDFADQAYAELEDQLPEGQLLGDIYPPRPTVK